MLRQHTPYVSEDSTATDSSARRLARSAMQPNIWLPVVLSSGVSTLVTALIFVLAMPGLVEAQVETLRAGQIFAGGENGGEGVRLSRGPGDVAKVSGTNTRGEDRIRLLVE